MVTHYILAGGADRTTQGYGDKLAEVVKKWKKSPLLILSVQFSKPRHEWEDGISNWTSWFRKYFGSDTTVELADPEKLVDQIERADLIYLHGGTTRLLVDALEKFDDLESYFKGKIVVGSSAGTNFLSKTYYSPKAQEMHRGTSIVPLNTIVHYGADGDGDVSLSQDRWREIVQEMKDEVGDEKITLLPEGEFVVVEK